MSFDGPRDESTRPMPQGYRPSPYPRQEPADPSGDAPTEVYTAVGHQPTARYQPVTGPDLDRSAGQGGQWYSGPGDLDGRAPSDGRAPADGPATQVFGAASAAPPSSPSGPSAPRRRGLRSWKVLVPATLVVLLGLGAGGLFAYGKLRGVTVEAPPSGTPTPSGAAATLPAGRTWLSGAWTGGTLSAERINAFGDWRGQPADVVTTYPAYKTWDEMRDSGWHVSTLNGFKGRLSYGLPLLPNEGDATLADVAAGKYDDVWKKIAKDLKKNDRGDAFVRIGLEANGDWFPWGSGVKRADDFKAAYRHVQSVLKNKLPNLSFGFDITCGHQLDGGKGRLDSLEKLYPGDDVVDVVGCDHYDQYTVKSRNSGEWHDTLRPDGGPGLADVADFARAHHKQLAVPEWGLASKDKSGAGDNPYFIYSMYQYFLQNKDILAYENYFNEAADSQGSALWGADNNTNSAAEYKKLWGAKPNLAAAPS